MKVVISTGAGISKASGLPIFRGDGGLWTDNPELEAKSSKAGAQNYLDELWDEWGRFRELASQCEPNSAHHAIAHWQGKLAGDMHVITQNVDGFHQDALIRLKEKVELEARYWVCLQKIYELHGNLWKSKCSNVDCNRNKMTMADSRTEKWYCSACTAPMRPDIVLFGEEPTEYYWTKSQGACLMSDLFIAVGTSGTVYPASELVTVAKKNGARTVLVNAEQWEYPHPDFDETIIGNAEDILGDVLEQEIGQANR